MNVPRLPRLPQRVDRSFARLVALKRIVTGSLGLLGGGVLVALALAQRAPRTGMLLLAVALFWGGGAWALRDGLRLRRALRSASVAAPDAP